MGLNCMGPHTCGFFSVVNTIVLHDRQLVESSDVEPLTQRSCCMEKLCIWSADYNLQADFRICRGSAPLTPALFKGQLYRWAQYSIKRKCLGKGMWECCLFTSLASSFAHEIPQLTLT